jgi:4-oxalocrotonate tautomerase family enzyme
MPYVAIKLIKELLTPELKAKYIARISDAVADVIVEATGADREKVLAHLWCVVEEVPFDNWGVGGVPVTLDMLKEALGIPE